ncbi:MAG TPA: MarR family transcriptional regulator [Gaiellales bacterium]
MSDPNTLASDLRVVIGRLVRRLRAERRDISLAQLTVLGRLDRDGLSGVSAIAAAERVRPQSVASTVAALEQAGLISRRPDPGDGRRVVLELTTAGREALADDRRRREGWLADAIARDLTADERRVLGEAAALLRRIADG